MELRRRPGFCILKNAPTPPSVSMCVGSWPLTSPDWRHDNYQHTKGTKEWATGGRENILVLLKASRSEGSETGANLSESKGVGVMCVKMLMGTEEQLRAAPVVCL